MTDQYSNYHSQAYSQQSSMHSQQYQQLPVTGQAIYQNGVSIQNNQSHSQTMINQPQKSDLTSSTNVYLSLLGLAESFQQSNQPRLCIHCLESILTLKPHDIPMQVNLQIQIKTRLNLCRLYLIHTLNTNQYLNAHLEKSMILVQNLNSNDEFKYEATYLIYKIFQKQKELHSHLKQNSIQSDPSQLTSLYNLDFIRSIFETSKSFPLWHLRLILLVGDILFKERDYSSAAFYMTFGIEYCAQNKISPYTHILLILCKGMIHLVQRNSTDLQTTMQPCAQMIENYQSNNIYQVETLKIFFLVLQVAYFLQCGQTKSVRGTLKNLQHYIQSLAARLENETNEHSLILSQDKCEHFFWMHKDHLGILAFLLTITNNLQGGSFDKADKLIERGLLNIQKLKLKEQGLSPALRGSSSLFSGSGFITNKFQLLLIENQVRCHLTMGNKSRAIKYLYDAFQTCDKDPRLMGLFSPQLHCLVGLYSLAVNAKDSAIVQFNLALKTTKDTDMWLYSAMNLALCYLDSSACSNTTNKTQLLSILDNVINEKFQTQNTTLNAFSNYFKALKFYLNSQYQQSQESLREAISIANSEDLLNITANSYLFMGHINLMTNQFQESYNMLVNGIDLAEKMSDNNLKLYGNCLLKYLYKYFNDPREMETTKKFLDSDNQSSLDLYEAVKLPQHALVNWNTNISPSQLLANISRNLNTVNTIPTNHLISSPQTSHQSPVTAQPVTPKHQMVNQTHHAQNYNSPTPKTPIQHHHAQSVLSPQQYNMSPNMQSGYYPTQHYNQTYSPMQHVQNSPHNNHVQQQYHQVNQQAIQMQQQQIMYQQQQQNLMNQNHANQY